VTPPNFTGYNPPNDQAQNKKSGLDSASSGIVHSSTKPIKVEFIVGIDKMYEDQQGLHIFGILSIPRASLNGWIYMPEELEKQGGKTVPMFFEHEEMFNPNAEPIGVMNTFWNSAFLQLEYEAVVTNKEKIDAIKAGKFKHVSMAATWEDFDLIRGWLFPHGIEIVEGSLVGEPGIPETTVSIIDHIKPERKFEEPMIIKDGWYPDAIVNRTKSKFIPTQVCTQNFCYSIMKDSHRASGVKSLACDKMSKEEKDETEKQDNKELGAPNQDIKPDNKQDDKEQKDRSDQRKLVILDSKGMKLLLQENTKFVVDAMKEVISPLQNTINNMPKTKPDPTALVSDGVVLREKVKDIFYRIATDSLRKYQELNWQHIAEQLRANNIGMDALGLTELGASAGAQWMEDITIVPSGLSVGLRNTCEVVIIERGAKEVHFTLLSTPTPADGSAPTVPTDVTQTITDILATPAERVLKQRVTDQAMRATRTDLAGGVARTFRNAEVLDEDDKILTELNAIVVGNLAGDFFGGNATSEATIDSADTFDHKLLAKAKRAILRKGWQEARMPGGLVCAMSPEQMEQLMSDTNIQRFIEWVGEGEAIRTGAIPRLHGVDLLVTSKVPTGTGAGMPAVTTHRAFVYVRNVAVGLAFTKDLTIETERRIEERATYIVGSYELAAKNKRADAAARIITYGSG